MELLVVSDLHFEFMADYGRSLAREIGEAVRAKHADVLVVAGDLAPAKILHDSLVLLVKNCPTPILFVAGNHEAYGSSIQEVRRILASPPPTVCVLDNSTVDIDGQRFIGGTMWFRQTSTEWQYSHLMSDFSVIGKFRHTYPKENQDFVDLIDREMNDQDVVISHHLPCYWSVPKRFKNSVLNQFFVCDVAAMIRRRQPKLWIHGHTHDSCDYKIHESRIVCNPFGYAGSSTNPNFRSDLTVTI